MATVTLTDLYSSLNFGPAFLLSASDGVILTAETATTFAYTFSAGTKFAGYSAISTGTGFTFDGNTPTDGTMSGLSITNASGQAELTVSGIAADTLASDLALFAAYEFGWTTPDGTVTAAYPVLRS
jgi:hypothetical protein